MFKVDFYNGSKTYPAELQNTKVRFSRGHGAGYNGQQLAGLLLSLECRTALPSRCTGMIGP